jgi:uncharacterized membrane protein (GlpM family)
MNASVTICSYFSYTYDCYMFEVVVRINGQEIIESAPFWNVSTNVMVAKDSFISRVFRTIADSLPTNN